MSSSTNKLSQSTTQRHLSVSNRLPILPQSAANDTRDAALNPVWGFDPLELLSKTEFPNDKYEQILRHSKDGRLTRGVHHDS
eukprot:jgi/Hompol1/4219/HPOL_003589-RA